MSTGVLFIQGGGEGAYAEDKVLAESLEHALGPDYYVRYPRMPNESTPSIADWGQKISLELSKISGKVMVVGHSLGGSILLQNLSDDTFGHSIDGLFVLAAPTCDNDQWNVDDLKLPSNIAKQLRLIPRIYFYHCRDDQVVPFAHLALHAAQIPQAITRAISHGGHQFGSDMTRIAIDIRGDDAGQHSIA